MRLGVVLRKWRLMCEKDLRTAAKEIGLGSAATLMRFEQGYDPDFRTWIKLMRWLTEKDNTVVLRKNKAEPR